MEVASEDDRFRISWVCERRFKCSKILPDLTLWNRAGVFKRSYISRGPVLARITSAKTISSIPRSPALPVIWSSRCLERIECAAVERSLWK